MDFEREGEYLDRMVAFPNRLANYVTKRWDHIASGDYEVPPCPPNRLLKQLLEACYLASNAAEEGRYPQFNVVATPEDETIHSWARSTCPFSASRSLTVQELRRLAPAVDVKKSAIWVVWGAQGLRVRGLIDLGTSWHRARVGLEYRYEQPVRLMVEIDRPGKLTVYQGEFRVATLADGELDEAAGREFHLFLHESVRSGLITLEHLMVPMDITYPRDLHEFEFTALWNTHAAIANSISLSGHGGMLVIVDEASDSAISDIRLKYRTESSALQVSYLTFVNLLRETYLQNVNSEDLNDNISLRARDAYDDLVEATRFVARLGGVDGCIVLSNDLRLLGFGGEIKVELADDARIVTVIDEMARRYCDCDITAFGTRHRAAIKLSARNPSCRVLAISQDGPITGVWSQDGSVLVKKVGFLTNLNIPWS